MNHESRGTARTVTLTASVIAVCAFTFSFGNIWHLALAWGIPAPIAPLVAPMLDVSVVGLMIAIRQLALRGIPGRQLLSARLLMLACAATTWGLNIAQAVIDQLGRRHHRLRRPRPPARLGRSRPHPPTPHHHDHRHLKHDHLKYDHDARDGQPGHSRTRTDHRAQAQPRDAHNAGQPADDTASLEQRARRRRHGRGGPAACRLTTTPPHHRGSPLSVADRPTTDRRRSPSGSKSVLTSPMPSVRGR